MTGDPIMTRQICVTIVLAVLSMPGASADDTFKVATVIPAAVVNKAWLIPVAIMVFGSATVESTVAIASKA